VEAAEAAYFASDPDAATDTALVALAELTGTPRRAATQGAVLATVNLNAGTYAAGSLIAHEDGNASNRWTNRDEIVKATSGSTSATFLSEATGSAATVAAGKLTKVAQAVTGWNSVTNATDATAGTDLETIEELRERRKVELQQAGSGTLGAIVAAVGGVAGVVEAVGLENVTAAPTTIDPHSFRVTVWDNGGAAGNDAIAVAILANRPAGVLSYGGVTGTAIDPVTGIASTERFVRATGVPVEIAVTIDSAEGVAIADVRAAVKAAFDSDAGIGRTVRYNRLLGAAFDVEGVDDVTAFTIDGGTSSVTFDDDERATLALVDITVTGDVS
jgi:uncharacterized phage protein gp47/JayE